MKGPQFVKLPRELLESPAWHSLSINARRLLDFLMIEHMRHGAKENGRLLAPQDQLVAFGIHTRLVSSAIDEVERFGLVDCRRGIGRRPNLYRLTWLPSSDGTSPSNRWRDCGAAVVDTIVARKSAKTRSVMPPKVRVQEIPALCADNTCQSAGTKPVVPPQSAGTTLPAKVQVPSRSSYQGGAAASVGEGEDSRLGVEAVAVRADGWRRFVGKRNGSVTT